MRKRNAMKTADFLYPVDSSRTRGFNRKGQG